MKRAAAAILTEHKVAAAQGLAIMEAAARDPSIRETEKLNIQLALIRGHSILEDYEKELALCADLAKQYPESRDIFLRQMVCLRVLKRFEEADRLATDRLNRISDDVDARRAQAWNALVRGDFARVRVLLQKMVDDGKAEPGDLNDIAWYSLFAGKVEPADFEDALKAAQLSNNNPSILHTLGCVYAEVGKTKEAREVLIQAMDTLNLNEPDDDYWYAFGRIAEQYGERDAALADYARLSRPTGWKDIPSATYYLAQTRLQVLRNEKHP